MATNPKTWIYGLVDILPDPFARAARGIADRVFGVLDDGVTFAKWIAGGVLKFYVAAVALGITLAQFVGEVALTLLWIEVIYVPRKVNEGVNLLRTFVAQEIGKAKAIAAAALKALSDFTIAQINRLIGVLNALRDYALSRLGTLEDRINNTVEKWFDRLTDPTKMAEWLIGALMGPLWRYVFSKRETIVTWFLNTSPAFSLWLVRILEPTIRKFL